MRKLSLIVMISHLLSLCCCTHEGKEEMPGDNTPIKG